MAKSIIKRCSWLFFCENLPAKQYCFTIIMIDLAFINLHLAKSGEFFSASNFGFFIIWSIVDILSLYCEFALNAKARLLK